ncbi:glycosyltransferase 87 family protein [Gordonia sp. HY442]|uniref:glycosyltransferase family 87 protein n=1 Tax=Gordonia zhenghanii TaxID=2911516 RepID=UPI001F013D8E|nr:glycosyltransferase 87 family protein [Gordonia zhenghanii]MCF8607711.1 glycosyltransferase 87 family protein [Gordonia zhenghanii]
MEPVAPSSEPEPTPSAGRGSSARVDPVGDHPADVELGDFESPAPLSDDRRLATDRVLPSWTEPMVTQLSTSIGGPIGVHAAVGRSRHWTPLRVVFLIALAVLALGWFGKAGCIQQTTVDGQPGQSRLDWDDQRQFYGLCYSNIVAGFSENRLTPHDLSEGAAPYRTFWDIDGERRYLEEPVVTGAFMYVVAQAARGWGGLTDAVGLPRALDVVNYFNIAAVLLALGWLLAIWATMRTRRRDPWIVTLVAVSPLALVHVFTAFEVLPVMFTALAMLAWSRDRLRLAGLFIGLGAATAFYPLLLLVAIGLLCVRQRRIRDSLVVGAAAAVTWAVVNIPVAVLYPSGWSASFTAWRDTAPGPDTVYRLIAETTGWAPPTVLVTALVIVLMLGVVAGVTYAAMRSPREPKVAALMFLLVAGYLLIGNDWRPEASLWLVPLAVLAIPHPRILLAWMTFDALLWVPRMALFLDPDRKWLPVEFFYIVSAARWLIVAGLCAYVVWEMVKPVLVRPAPAEHLLRSPAA